MATAIYCRISSDPEGLALGVERQEEDCRQLAEKRAWEPVEVFTDNDVTASGKRVRPAWDRMLKEIADGRFDSLVAYSSSRMYRNLRDLTALIDLADAKGLEIVTVASGDINLSTADGRMIARLLASIDQAEWERTSERRKRQNQQKREKAAKEGKVLRYAGRRRAFGYSADGHSLNQEEAVLLKEAVARIIAGEATPYRICMEWRDKGVTTPYGAQWVPSHLKRTLRGKHLLGTSDSPALVTEDEHELLLAALPLDRRSTDTKRDSRGRVASPGRPSGRRYAALRLLKCGICASTLTGRGGQYICQGCGKLGVKATPIEQYLVAQAFIHAPAGNKPIPKPVPNTRPLLADIRKLDVRYAEVELAVRNGDMPAKAGGRLLTDLDAERIELQRQLGRDIRSRSDEAPRLTSAILSERFFPQYKIAGSQDSDYQERWVARVLTDAEIMTLQDFLRTFIESAKVASVGRTGKFFDPERVAIKWREL